MRKLTSTDLSQINGHLVGIESLNSSLSNSNIWLSGIILQALNLVQSLQKIKPPKTFNDVFNPTKVQEVVKDSLKDRLLDALDNVPSGRSKEEIAEDNQNLILDIKDVFAQELKECLENLPSDGRTLGGLIATGYQITDQDISLALITLASIKTNFIEYKQFNKKDLIESIKSALDDLPTFVVEQIEANIVNKIIEKRGEEEGTCNRAIALIDKAIERLSNLSDCAGAEDDDIRVVKDPPKTDAPPVPSTPKPPTPPASTGDCCGDLVAAINNLSSARFDYEWMKMALKAMCDHLTRWIRETRIELKEARRDAKIIIAKADRNYTWIRDSRIELKEARRDLKAVLRNQDLILDYLSDVLVESKKARDEAEKTRKLVDWNSKMLAIGIAGLGSLIGGVATAVGAALSAILAAIGKLSVAVLAALSQGFLTLGKLTTTGFLKNQTQMLRMSMQIARGFNRIEDLVNPYIKGEVTSYDWVEMTDAEKAQVDKEQQQQQQQNIINEIYDQESQELVDPASSIVLAGTTAITVTKAVALTYLKLNPKTIVYAGYGLLGAVTLIEKLVSIANDLQGDVKEPSTLAMNKIKVPIIDWQPQIYNLDLKGDRKYQSLNKVQNNLYKAPDYESSTPYIKLIDVNVPVGMESLYLSQYNLAVDDFFNGYLNPPIILMPDGWEGRPMKYRPQLEFYYVKVLEDGTFERATNYTLNVQHYDYQRLGKPTKSPLPEYTKGGIFATMVLADGAKDIVFGKNKEEVLKVMRAIKAITIPEFVEKIVLDSPENNSLKWGETKIAPNGNPIHEITVFPIWCDYYSKGRLNRTYAIQRDWRVFFDRPNL